MHLFKNPALGFASLGLFTGFTMAASQGCDIAEQCGLTCSAEGILEGNASISGIPSIDAFFGAIIDVSVAAGNVRAGVQAELDAMALSLGLPAGSGSADIKAALEAQFAASVEGGIQIKWKPAECSASVEVAASAAAECDVDVDLPVRSK